MLKYECIYACIYASDNPAEEIFALREYSPACSDTSKNIFFCRSSNLKSLDSTLTSKTEALQECNNQRIRAEEKSKQLEQEKESREALVLRLKDEVVKDHS